MYTFELDAIEKGYKTVAGVDEAGRGPLAGPVVAAAVVFKGRPVCKGINDSKKLTHARRIALLPDIYNEAMAVGLGFVWPEEIDEINIHNASLKAMAIAVEGLVVRPDFLLIDGRFRIKSDIAQRPVISGDALSVSVAAASIVAKTARDAVMRAYHSLYPMYGFAAHNGYPTKAHYKAIRAHGPCPIHRMTYKGVLSGANENS